MLVLRSIHAFTAAVRADTLPHLLISNTVRSTAS